MTYSLYSGSGPSLVSYSGPFQSGIAFEVTEGGCWFNAYRWWVPAGGDTGAQKFALWCITVNAATGNSLISGSVVTSGTLTADAWNVVPLPSPVQLSIGAAYVAATGWTAVNGFPDTNSQFGSGGPYAAGITNGPLFAYSDPTSGGTGPEIPTGLPQGQFGDVSGDTDPSVYMPVQASNSANFGMDVVVSDTAPGGYAGSWRIWPNFASVGPQNDNQVDLNDAYILGTEFTLSQACTLDNIWFYSPSGASGLPTQCAIWNVSTQTMVSGTLKTSPGWSGSAGSGWVPASYSGVTLPAGDYKVSVWNASASGTGTGWNEYTLDYFTTGAGAGGIVSGPITVPDATTATTPGQSTYSTSTSSFLYPDTYVVSEGQSYWVDVEVTPLPSPAAPQPPQPGSRRWHLRFRRPQVTQGPHAPAPASVTASAGLAAAGGAAPRPGAVLTVQSGPAVAAGAAPGPVPSATPSAGLAAAAGTAPASVPSLAAADQGAISAGSAPRPATALTVPAGLAAGTGSAPAPVPQVTAADQGASAAGTAPEPSLTLSSAASAGLASAAGSAPSPVPQVTTAADRGALAAGLAPGPVPVITAAAGLPAGTSTAPGPAAGVTAADQGAQAAGTAPGPVPEITVSGQGAVAAGIAPQPVIQTSGSTTASAGLASASGTAPGPVPAVTAAGQGAAAAGSAPGPSPSVTASDSGAQAAGTAPAPVPEVTAAGQGATAAGTSPSPLPVIGPAAGPAPGSGLAPQPGVSLTVSAGLAAASGSAPSPAAAITALAGQPAATAQALAPLAAAETSAGLAAAAGIAPRPSVTTSGSVTALAGLASASGIAPQPSVTAAPFPDLAFGDPYLSWATGTPYTSWSTGTPYT